MTKNEKLEKEKRLNDEIINIINGLVLSRSGIRFQDSIHPYQFVRNPIKFFEKHNIKKNSDIGQKLLFLHFKRQILVGDKPLEQGFFASSGATTMASSGATIPISFGKYIVPADPIANRHISMDVDASQFLINDTNVKGQSALKLAQDKMQEMISRIEIELLMQFRSIGLPDPKKKEND